jgi:ribosomal protein L7Ae-like RNA K-turn-binding protein
MTAFLTLLGFAQKAGKIVTGEDTVQVSLKKKKLKLLIVAGDASANTKDRANQWKVFYDVPFLCVLDKETLSQAIGKNNRALIGVTDRGFAVQLLKAAEKTGELNTEVKQDVEN